MLTVDISAAQLGGIYDHLAGEHGSPNTWKTLNHVRRAQVVLMLDLLHHYVDVNQVTPSAGQLAAAAMDAAFWLGYKTTHWVGDEDGGLISDAQLSAVEQQWVSLAEALIAQPLGEG